jgi:prepilin-type N-terminal cleavage/methylation domain-containing protein
MISKTRYTGIGQKGLTLPEVMVVISIVALLALIGISSFSGSLPLYRLKSSARDLVSNMRMARQQAATENWQYAINFQTPTTYDVVRGDKPIIQNSGAFVTVKSVTAERDVTWAMPAGMPLFQPNGLISSWDPMSNAVSAVAPDSIVMTDYNADTKTIVIGTSGRIRVE